MRFLFRRSVFKKILKKCQNSRDVSHLRALPTGGPWNVAFFGNDDFALESLKKLYEKLMSRNVECLSVVTSGKLDCNPVAHYATEHQLPWTQWPLEHQPMGFHIGVVVSFGHLIPSSIIKSFPLGMLNVHASLLPKWRGAAPISYSLFNGERKTGVTIMRLKPKRCDIGEIIVQRETNIGAEETNRELRPRLARLGAELLDETVDQLPGILEQAKSQNEAQATYAPKLTAKKAFVNWDTMTAQDVYNLYRGLNGIFSLATKFKDRTVKLLDVQIAEPTAFTNPYEQHPSGTVIYEKKGGRLLIKCQGESWLSVKRVILPNKRATQAVDFRSAYLSRGTTSEHFY